MKKFIYILFPIFALLLMHTSVQASGCYKDPIYERDWHGHYDIAAFVRDNACMEGTEIIETVAQGTVVEIIAETDGWYKVKTPIGNIGWTGARLMSKTDNDLTVEKNNFEKSKLEKDIRHDSPVTQQEEGVASHEKVGTTFLDRVSGRLLLQVQQGGRIWYVDPVHKKRYEVTFKNALPLFEKLALGITNIDLEQIPQMNCACLPGALSEKLKGRLLLQVQDRGRIWYVDQDGYKHEVTWENLMNLFRSLSLGITDFDLGKITEDALLIQSYEENNSKDREPLTVNGESTLVFDISLLNEYWLTKINNLRAKQGLRLLKTDQRFVNTAQEWADYMANTGSMSHTRSDGKSMHDWIDAKNLDFTDRYSESGWNTNYFTENIAWQIAPKTLDGAKYALDSALDMYLSESSYNGPHYRTIYHEDWNSVGVGMYFEDYSDDKYKVYMSMHYGSLK